jgi:hypothetical protein
MVQLNNLLADLADIDERVRPHFISRMSDVEKPATDVFIEGIRERTQGDASDANPYPLDARELGVWFEGWRIYDALQETPPTGEDVLESLVRGDRH